MTSTPVTNLNALSNLDDAEAYFADSVRGAAWDGVDPDSQARNLLTSFRILNRQRWAGTATGVSIVTSVAVASGGSGYSAGDEITIDGASGDDLARVEVLTVSSGAVATVKLLDAGGYATAPSSPAATSASTGTGCTLTVTTGDQVSQMPRTGMRDRYGDVVDPNLVPPEIVEASLELALALYLDPTLEGQTSTAQTAVKRAKGGSAEVEFFAPGAFVSITRFPPEVQELIAPFLAGSSDGAAPEVGGSEAFGGGCSQFDDCDSYGITRGF